MILGDIGDRVEILLMEDDDNLVEEIAVKGMDEAAHEQMLAAAIIAGAEDAELELAESDASV